MYAIYIPIWLDLLYTNQKTLTELENNLHSNMVRFIIKMEDMNTIITAIFTFQYGQIYYEVFTSN